MIAFYTNSLNGERIATPLNKKQAHLLYENTKETMLEIGENTGIMWEMNYEVCDYFSFDGADELTPTQYRMAFNAVVKACESVAELKGVYQPIKTALMSDPRFQAA